jgi:hypothetical protein
MKKRLVSNSSVGRYWIWEFPEVVDDLSRLFEPLGVLVDGVTTSLPRVAIDLKLKSPLKVRDWRIYQGNDIGIAINSATLSIIGAKPQVSVLTLPQDGDTSVKLRLSLELHTFDIDDVLTVSDMHQGVRELVKSMAKTWVYHFLH